MPNELSALVTAVGEAADRLAITPAESLHAAIAGRVFDSTLLPVLWPTRLVHDRVAAATYSAVRFATTAVARAAADLIRAAGRGADVRPLSRTAGGRAVLCAVNGLIGDLLEEGASDLAIPMAVRHAGADVACSRGPLADVFPEAAPRVALFLHGLAGSEEVWRPSGLRSGDRLDFGAGLSRDAGMTPVYVRYNTGLPVDENGRQLAELLESLVAAWPTGVSDVVMVGHSMGGLVACSACQAGSAAGHAWPALARHVVTLGTPHAGAPVAQAVHVLARALRTVPEARPLADVLDARSAGVRDLRSGARFPALPGCERTYVAATVSRDPEHLLGRIVGDLLVLAPSATGEDPEAAAVRLGGLTHFDLPTHPLVYPLVRDAVTGSPSAV